MKRILSFAAVSAALALSAFAEPTMSNGTFVNLRPETTSFWHTATNDVMSLPVTYPSGASSATLTVQGVGYSRTYSGITGDSFELHLPKPISYATEDVFDLTLTFSDGTVRTAKLGLVTSFSADGTGTTRCIAPVESRKWRTMRKTAVFPIPYGTTAFSVSVNGSPTVLDSGLGGAQGWYALGGIMRGDEVSVSRTAGGVSDTVDLTGIGGEIFTIKFK